MIKNLLKLGDKAAESVGSAVGKDGWETAKKIWEKIHPKLAGNEDAKIAVEQLAAKPESKPRRDVFEEELAALIKNNPELSEAIAKILQESPPLTPSVLVIGQMTGVR